MALFFDSDWFDSRLAAARLKRADAATALGLSDTEIAELWKDQRELSAHDVRLLAALLGAPREEVARRAGVSTPLPYDEDAGIGERLARIEAELAEIKSQLATLRASR
jgi:transcriptional regulator with XRE-family HTH domain